MKYYLQAFRKYAQFTGRASRKEYWYFILFNALFTYAFLLTPFFIDRYSDLAALPFVIYTLGAQVPILAVGVRRMHDVGKSGWYLLIPFYNFVLAVTKSDPNTNKWGKPEN